ncbi:MAG: molybdenum cofactor guanylyltransferase [Acidobacteria bacterium]|nr:molybdenum cofactor guanylyltransferase [Acidobacteriota bacterium]
MTSPLRPEAPRAAAAILAGGRATRMGGVSKALLPFEGSLLIDRQLRVLAPIFEVILIAAAPSHDPAPFLARGLTVVTDRHEGEGPLAGLHAALTASPAPWLFAVACDMPFLDADLIASLWARAARIGEADALVPKIRGRVEPLHAFYRASAAGVAEACLLEGSRAMSDLLSRVRVRFVDEGSFPALSATRSFVNLNSPGDVAAAKEGP